MNQTTNQNQADQATEARAAHTPGPWSVRPYAAVIADDGHWPELLEALEHAVNWGIGFAESNGQKPPWLDEARAAIAKAKPEVAS
ncbi:MAG: hypothetical protein BWZ08_02309 [candidate division BRC1 bacterium ADurb.BinA292]|nr:MAG: hypothetical protein BWZ08_02309 [candidate division BRC1 bacterium ADurb.BinA292]